MPGPDLDAIRARAARAHWLAKHNGPRPDTADLRVHFEIDVPALIREIEWLRNVVDRRAGGATEPPRPA